MLAPLTESRGLLLRGEGTAAKPGSLREADTGGEGKKASEAWSLTTDNGGGLLWLAWLTEVCTELLC